MAQPNAVLREQASSVADRVRRLWALVVAARDLASAVSSQDPNLAHAQELLAAADEAAPVLVAETEALQDSLRISDDRVSATPVAA